MDTLVVSKMVVKNGDESQGTIRKKITLDQYRQDICT